MTVIDDVPLRWALTGLFLLSGVGFALVTDRRSWTSVVSFGLHLTTVIAMALMAWPQGLGLPPQPAEVFFLVAALWFVITAVLATRMIAMRVVRGYHALKMLAMAWMYAVVHHPPGPDEAGAEHHHHHHLPPDQPMPDMDVTAPGAQTANDWPNWIDAGNWIWTLIFVLAAVVWGSRFVAPRRGRRRRRSRSWRRTLGYGGQMIMAAGMAIMFGALLVQG